MAKSVSKAPQEDFCFTPCAEENFRFLVGVVVGSLTETNAYQCGRNRILTFYDTRLLLRKLQGPGGQIVVAAMGFVINLIFGCSLKAALSLSGQTFPAASAIKEFVIDSMIHLHFSGTVLSTA